MCTYYWGDFLVGVSIIALVTDDDNIDAGSPPIIIRTTNVRMPH